MPSTYAIAVVPVASRATAEAAVAPMLLSPNADGVYSFSVPLVPLPGDADAEPTHYGTCAAVGPETVAALPLLQAAIPGCEYHAVEPGSYTWQSHWIDWLTSLGLQPRVAGGD
jgi:hypothetical protein